MSRANRLASWIQTIASAAGSARDEFLSLVTHEIKNPLTSINGYAVLLDASKMTAGRFSITHGEIDMAEIVSQTARKYAATSGHKVDLSIDEDLPSFLEIPSEFLRSSRIWFRTRRSIRLRARPSPLRSSSRMKWSGSGCAMKVTAFRRRKRR